jgi:hypothetical protein
MRRMPCLTLLLASLAAARPPTVIRPGTPDERAYLVEDHSALREIGYDPLCPFTRIADGTMSYTYRFAAGRGHRAWLLVKVSSQFLILARGDADAEYRRVADMDEAEYVGTRVFLDLTPFLSASEAVLVRFEDKHKEDGWGALTSEILYYRDDAPGPTRLALNPNGDPPAQRDGQVVVQASRLQAAGTAAPQNQWPVEAPASWAGEELVVYVPQVAGGPPAIGIDGQALPIGRTWDGGYWADASTAMRPRRQQVLSVTGDLGLPVRVGLRLPACAVPVAKRVNHAFAPYQPERMDCLAGNYLQCLLDTRYDLLAFTAGERQPIHFVHDTLRSLAALAEEARHTPVARPELAQRLFRGCRQAILPGGERIFAFKHDERPIDIRPLPGSHDLTLMHKLDVARTVAAVGVSLPGAEEADAVTDTPPAAVAGGTAWHRAWRFGAREVGVTAFYPPGDADRPPRFDWELDGRGPVRLHVRRLAETGMWFTPGSWGPEALVLPDGSEHWAYNETLGFEHPDLPYLLLRGGNTGEYTFCRALLVASDQAPDRITLTCKPGGRHGKLIDDLVLEYANERPAHLGLTVFPFTGYPAGLATPRAIAENLRRGGELGCGKVDPVETATSNGLGPGAMAAAAWLLRRYGLPDAEDAEALAVQTMRDTIDRDAAGLHSEQLYYLIDAPRLLAELGHREFLPQLGVWGRRILSMQAADGSYAWLDFQFRMMVALRKLFDETGDERYRAAFDRALATIEYRDDRLFWKGQPQTAGDFAGALPFAIYAHLGRREAAATVLRARAGYIDDRGFQACSDLNPYMLGFAFAGWRAPTTPPIRLGLSQFAIYGVGMTAVTNWPTAYVVNPWHPFAEAVTFKLP